MVGLRSLPLLSRLLLVPKPCLPQRSAPKDNCKMHRENDQIMSNMEQWAKEQK